MARQMAASQSMQAGMQILQASALELKQLLRHALETNPMLEELPDTSPEALEDGPDGDATLTAVSEREKPASRREARSAGRAADINTSGTVSSADTGGIRPPGQ